jgi:hypothetical protein
LIAENGKAGTVFRGDHGIRHPHDLGNRACIAFKRQNAHQAINRDITPLCRGPGGIPTSGHIAAAQTREADRRAAVQADNEQADETIRAAIRDLNVSRDVWMAAGGSERQFRAYAVMGDDTRRHWLGSHPELARYLFPDGILGSVAG